MSRVESEALDNIQQFVAIQRDSELQVASAFLSPLSLSRSLFFFSFSMFALPCWSRGTHKLICVGIGFVWICLPCGWYCLVDTFPHLPHLPAAAAGTRSAPGCRSFRALFTQINWTAANLLHKTLPNAVASAAFVNTHKHTHIHRVVLH